MGTDREIVVYGFRAYVNVEKTMYRLVSVHAKDCRAQDLRSFCIDQHFHEAAGIAEFAGATDPRHRPRANQRRLSRRSDFALGQPNAAERRIDKQVVARVTAGPACPAPITTSYRPTPPVTFVYPTGTLRNAMKDVGLRIRVERKLRAAFVDACRAEGKTAAQVLREYMRKYANYDERDPQGELFEPNKTTPRT
jgi:hypothetical protein